MLPTIDKIPLKGYRASVKTADETDTKEDTPKTKILTYTFLLPFSSMLAPIHSINHYQIPFCLSHVFYMKNHKGQTG